MRYILTLFILIKCSIPLSAQVFLDNEEKLEILSKKSHSNKVVKLAMDGDYTLDQLEQLNRMKSNGINDSILMQTLQTNAKLSKADISKIKNYQTKGYSIDIIIKVLEDQPKYPKLKDSAKDDSEKKDKKTVTQEKKSDTAVNQKTFDEGKFMMFPIGMSISEITSTQPGSSSSGFGFEFGYGAYNFFSDHFAYGGETGFSSYKTNFNDQYGKYRLQVNYFYFSPQLLVCTFKPNQVNFIANAGIFTGLKLFSNTKIPESSNIGYDLSTFNLGYITRIGIRIPWSKKFSSIIALHLKRGVVNINPSFVGGILSTTYPKVKTTNFGLMISLNLDYIER